VQVFALGGFGKADDAVDTGYYATRAALAGTMTEALRHVARRGLSNEGAPALVRLISAVAARFGVVVSDKLALTAVPVLGALSGAAINTAFLAHFQRLAEGHFTLRALERRHGLAVVRRAYDEL
jgi:hypothetical protein